LGGRRHFLRPKLKAEAMSTQPELQAERKYLPKEFSRKIKAMTYECVYSTVQHAVSVIG
jgi:hypothetical protein